MEDNTNEGTTNSEASSSTETTSTEAGTEAQNEQVVPLSKLWWVGMIAIAVASIPNILFLLASKSLMDMDWHIPLGGPDGPLGPLPIPAILIFNTVGTIGATIVLAMLGKFVSRPFRVFFILSIVVVLGSFILPIGLPEGVTDATKIGLSVMHVISWVAIVGVMNKMGRQK